MLIALEDTGVKILKNIINDIYDTGKIPVKLTRFIIITISKKNIQTTYVEFRTISLVRHTLKYCIHVKQKDNYYQI